MAYADELAGPDLPCTHHAPLPCARHAQEFDDLLPKQDEQMTRLQKQAADAFRVLGETEAGLVCVLGGGGGAATKEK